jgi:hypothetical protein
VIESATVILVEGASDRVAVEALAARYGRDLTRDRIAIVAMGGASAFAEHLVVLANRSGSARLAGLCDEGEVGDLQRGLALAGFGAGLSRMEMEELGFFVCVADLEEELIRALGVDDVERVVARQGELRALRSMQNQPAWRGRPREQQLRRFFGSKSGRKALYGRLMVEALDLERVPRPLRGLLAHV